MFLLDREAEQFWLWSRGGRREEDDEMPTLVSRSGCRELVEVVWTNVTALTSFGCGRRLRNRQGCGQDPSSSNWVVCLPQAWMLMCAGRGFC